MSSLSAPLAPKTARTRRAPWTAIVVVVWGLALLGAFGAIWRYKTTPGGSAEPPAAWPSDVGVSRAPDRATVVMLAHPHCQCTRASLSELAVLMTKLGDSARAYVLFTIPNGTEEGWEKTDTWARASEIGGVTVIADRGGAMGRRFGATVSGHTVVYDASGRLLFRGGITSARGHAGDNAGRSLIVAAVQENEAARVATPTFGCKLADKETEQ